jgi:hypothetical protein
MVEKHFKNKIAPVRSRGGSLVINENEMKFFLQSNVDFIRQFFYQSKFKSISKRQFLTPKVIRILNIRHVISRQ